MKPGVRQYDTAFLTVNPRFGESCCYPWRLADLTQVAGGQFFQWNYHRSLLGYMCRWARASQSASGLNFVASPGEGNGRKWT